MPWVSAKDLKSDRIQDAELHISEKSINESATKVAPAGSLLMLVRGMGLANGVPLAEVMRPVAFNQDVRAIRPPKTVLPRFLLLALRAGLVIDNGEILSSAAHGTLKIDTEKLRQLRFPVPTLSEQRRIIAILDEVFEDIAIAKANAEKNLQNARAIFESHLSDVFTRHSGGSVPTTLGREIDLLAGFAFKSSGYTQSEESIRLLRGDNILPRALRWNDVMKWPSTDTEAFRNYELQEDDVVIAMDRPWIKAGLKHAMISQHDLPSLLVQRVARLRSGPRILSRFLFYLIGSEPFSRHILDVQTGIGVPHISGQQISDFSFDLPPDQIEQRRVVRELDDLWLHTQRLEALYQQKLAALDALKRSFLHDAFSGRLQ